jgi:hypothetical protein
MDGPDVSREIERTAWRGGERDGSGQKRERERWVVLLVGNVRRQVL